MFVAKGRDGKTDIWGIIVRPTNFDPKKKYPVIEKIYAGPQGIVRAEDVRAAADGMQSLAELGFIVVQIDGMGTANRSKAFHDVAWKNLATPASRIASSGTRRWPRSIRGTTSRASASTARRRADRTRSAALLFHPEFYKAAVSAAGCHDNRMDKIWWNEQWMGWPLGPQYAASSNVDNAAKLQGHLHAASSASSTRTSIRRRRSGRECADQGEQGFRPARHPGRGSHATAARTAIASAFDFFVRHLQGRQPPAWDALRASAPDSAAGVLDARAEEWAQQENW